MQYVRDLQPIFLFYISSPTGSRINGVKYSSRVLSNKTFENFVATMYSTVSCVLRNLTLDGVMPTAWTQIRISGQNQSKFENTFSCLPVAQVESIDDKTFKILYFKVFRKIIFLVTLKKVFFF